MIATEFEYYPYEEYEEYDPFLGKWVRKNRAKRRGKGKRPIFGSRTRGAPPRKNPQAAKKPSPQLAVTPNKKQAIAPRRRPVAYPGNFGIPPGGGRSIYVPGPQKTMPAEEVRAPEQNSPPPTNATTPAQPPANGEKDKDKGISNETLLYIGLGLVAVIGLGYVVSQKNNQPAPQTA